MLISTISVLSLRNISLGIPVKTSVGPMLWLSSLAWKSSLMREALLFASSLACMQTIKYSYNMNSKPHKWSVILASVPQRENKALCPITNRWRFHGCGGFQAVSPSYVHTSRRERSSKLACIKPPRINMENWDHQRSPTDAWALEGSERVGAASHQRCSSKMFCGIRSPKFHRGEGVQCYLPAPGSLTNSSHSFLNVKAALSSLPGNPDGNTL